MSESILNILTYAMVGLVAGFIGSLLVAAVTLIYEFVRELVEAKP